jgi:hypothetical protein
MEEELVTLSEHLSSPPIYCGVPAAKSLVCLGVVCLFLFFFVVFCFDHHLPFFSFSSGHYMVCPSIYGFR